MVNPRWRLFGHDHHYHVDDVNIPLDVYHKIDFWTYYILARFHCHCLNILKVKEAPVWKKKIKITGLNRANSHFYLVYTEKICLPCNKQVVIKQLRTSVELLVWQSFPPYIGGGLVHVRWRNWNPVPHEALHVAQFDQSEKPPSTVNKTTVIKLHKKGAWHVKLLYNQEVKVKLGAYTTIIPSFLIH